MTGEESLLNTVHAGFRYASTNAEVLSDINIELHPGTSVGLVGESGAGKSTILSLLLGIHTPTSGTVVFEGRPLNIHNRRQLRSLRKSVQTVFQDPYRSLDPRMRIEKIIAEPLRALGLVHELSERRDEVSRLLIQVGLDPEVGKRYPAEFSGGQRQRIAIARALAPRPKILLADEAVSALDVTVKIQIIELLAQLVADQGMGMLFVSHDLAAVSMVCDCVVVLDHGHIVENGSTKEVLANPQNPYTQRLLAAIPLIDDAE